MYNRLISFINDNKLIDRFQFGFQEEKSTCMALLTLIDDITEALDKGGFVVGVFLDFSKAFDTVDHNILLTKLHSNGIKDRAHTWFVNYLKDRQQYVSYNCHNSERVKITHGVPQGSILGPLLFLLYINDLSTVSKALKSVLYADDTNLFIAGNDPEKITQIINADLSNIKNWLACNKLSLNILKTQYMVFVSRNKSIVDLRITIGGVRIERVYITKFLGVQIDCNLSWKYHVDYICKKLSKCIGVLCKARKKLQKSTVISLYYSFVYPLLIYCNPVWGNCCKTTLEKLVLTQKKIIRIITNSPYRAHTAPLMYANKILSIRQINWYVTGQIMYKCIKSVFKNCTIFNDYFKYNSEVHSHETRVANMLHVPYGRLDIRKSSFKIYGAYIWNYFPENITSISSLFLFKKHLRDYIIENVSMIE
jgi:hypothetical protein